MPSILPNYEYDIFISYRQNDNKRDGWVSNFVQALKDELDATLKNPVSIYFDENPHDGLLETHQVGATLDKKLKCLIFIPIISQTYCDQSSFAWSQELLPFNAAAKTDDLGMNIALANGNVSSRILPIRIHELDDSDEQILADELGGSVRSVDFIYKEPGVNRPLKPGDKREDNLNKTNYHNQINKVANALKEIGQAMLKMQESEEIGKKLEKNPVEISKSEAQKLKPWIVAAGIILLVLVGYFIFNNINPTPKRYDYDIAVIYFENLTDDDRYDDGLVNLIHINLAEDTSLNLVPRQKMYDALKEINDQAKNPDQTVATELATNLNVQFMVIGRIIQQGVEVLAQVELVEVTSGKVVATEKIRARKEEIFTLADNITSQLMAGQIPERNYNVTALTTSNYEAYQHFYQGLEYIWDIRLGDAADEFSKAIEIDSTFAMAYVYKAVSENMFGSVDIFVDPERSRADMALAQAYQQNLSQRDKLFVKLITQRVNIDPGYYETLAELNRLDPYDRLTAEFNAWDALERPDSLAIKRHEEAIIRNPKVVELYNMLGYVSAHYGQKEKAIQAIDKYRSGEVDVWNAYHSSWEVNMLVGNYQQALKHGLYIEKNYPNSTTRYVWRGLTYLFLHEPDSTLLLYNNIREPRSVSHAAIGGQAYLEKGQWTQAINEVDKHVSRAEDQAQTRRELFLRLTKPVIYMTKEDRQGALREIDIIYSKSQSLSYNPFNVIATYYRFLVHFEDGNIDKAEETAKELEELIMNEAYDSRFKQFVELCELDLALAKGKLVGLEEKIKNSSIYFRRSSPRLFDIELRYLIASEQYQRALKHLSEIYRHTYSARYPMGGDNNLFTVNLLLSNYYLGMIHEKLGNKTEAQRAYEAFLYLLRDAEADISKMRDARSRLAALQ